MTAMVLRGDAAHLPLPDASVDLIVTSPPYFGLRSYTDGGEHYAGQIGSEATPAEWLANMMTCTREFIRVLKPEGSLFVNLGDKNANKCLLGLPWRYALACVDQLGLILRAEIVWAKPNGLPESVTDRVRRAHEQVFHLVKSPRYYAAVDEIREPHTGNAHGGGQSVKWGTGAAGVKGWASGDNSPETYNPLGKLPGSVWTIPSQPLTVPPNLGVDHFAAFPMELPRRLILGWSPPGICTGCGQGRRPVVDKQLVNVWHDKPAQNSRHLGTRGEHQNNLYGVKQTFGSTAATVTGYACACTKAHRPHHESCAESREGCMTCDPPPTRPAVVLDPFGGTGTTALIASAYGRTGITIDRSADYSRLAAWRTTDRGELARALEFDRPPAVIDGQGALFAL